MQSYIFNIVPYMSNQNNFHFRDVANNGESEDTQSDTRQLINMLRKELKTNEITMDIEFVTKNIKHQSLDYFKKINKSSLIAINQTYQKYGAHAFVVFCDGQGGICCFDNNAIKEFSGNNFESILGSAKYYNVVKKDSPLWQHRTGDCVNMADYVLIKFVKSLISNKNDNQVSFDDAIQKTSEPIDKNSMYQYILDNTIHKYGNSRGCNISSQACY